MRQDDYTRKTQAVAQQRQYVEQGQQILQNRLREVEALNAQIVQFMAARVPLEPDEKMWADDFFGATEQHRLRERAMQELVDLQQSYNGYQQQTMQQQSQQLQQTIWQRQQMELQTLVTKMPQLQDPKKAQAFVNDMAETFQHYGFSPQEIQQGLHDHRYAVMAADALRWRRSQTNKQDAARKGRDNVSNGKKSSAPVTRAGKRIAPAAMQSQSVKQAQERFNRSGDLNDAAELLMARSRRH